MEPKNNKYPVFETNQVLLESHLNQLFDYLDENERLTRANFIGIGIVCGLDVRVEAPATIHLSKGCGITSEGYLIEEPEKATFVSYRKYGPPNDSEYKPFVYRDLGGLPQAYDVWELLTTNEANTTPLEESFLEDKAMLLLLELKEASLRNCSASNCNERGAEKTAIVRRLLISTEDLEKIIKANKPSDADFSRVELTDLRLHRYYVPNSDTASTPEVLAGFFMAINSGNFVAVGDALNRAYDAFKPLIEDIYPENPFDNFSTEFSFLDEGNALEKEEQILFLQYYYDFFDDLINAYNEFREKGKKLLCECCPSGSLFPQHLILGELKPVFINNSSIYRNTFTPSPAIGGCEERVKEVKFLFRRMVEMTRSFTNLLSENSFDEIRITPSKLGDVPISEKAIPYYYSQDGDPPLYKLWNFEKTGQNRANHNLSYHSKEYEGDVPEFIKDALSYDLEPYNFLRVEGHLGKNYKSVLNSLISLKQGYQLPVEIIALRAGAFDEKMAVDLSKEECRFQDLEMLYDALREELLDNLCEGVMYFYDIPIKKLSLPDGEPKLPLLNKYAARFFYKEDSVGAWYEKYLSTIQSKEYIDVDQNNVDVDEVMRVYCLLFAGTLGLPEENYAHVVSIYYLTKLAEVLPSSLDALGYADFENKYQDLQELVRYFRSDIINNISSEFEKFMPQEDLIDHFDQVLFSCKLEPVKAIHQEYVRRIRKVKQEHFFRYFLQKHPGIQHKSGVPMSGTFIIVYHEKPGEDAEGSMEYIWAEASRMPFISTTAKTKFFNALDQLKAEPVLMENPDIKYILKGWLSQNVAEPFIIDTGGLSRETEEIFNEIADNLEDGTVIADFFLPYLCCSDCPPVQYVLPTPPISLTVDIGCTNPEDTTAEVTLQPQGGEKPFRYQLDEGPIKEFKEEKLILPIGRHTIKVWDSAGAEAESYTFTIPEPLTIGDETYTDNVAEGTYIVNFNISGGMKPYQADESGTVINDKFTSHPMKSGKKFNVTIFDNWGCKSAGTFHHTVPLPFEILFDLGCTNAKGIAPISFKPQGGKAPYTYKVDDQPYEPLRNSISLRTGSYTVVVRDSEGVESASQTFTVPEALSIKNVIYKDLTDNTYTFNFTIEGGTPPYTSNVGTVDNTAYTYNSEPLQSGKKIRVIILDKKKCEISDEFEHTVEAPCKLPCKGIARRCGFRFWLPEPEPDQKKMYTSYGAEVLTFKFDSQESGESIEFADYVNKILNNATHDELNKNFEGAVQLLLEAINDLVAEKLGADWLYLEYVKGQTESIGTLWIEYFECLDFSFHIQTFFQRPEKSEQLDLLYTPKGTEIIEWKTLIPAFDCTQIDKCTSGRPTINPCEKVDMELEINSKADSSSAFLDFETKGQDKLVTHIWEVEDGSPPFSTEKEATFKFEQTETKTKWVRLTAFSENRCRVIEESTIKLSG